MRRTRNRGTALCAAAMILLISITGERVSLCCADSVFPEEKQEKDPEALNKLASFRVIKTSDGSYQIAEADAKSANDTEVLSNDDIQPETGVYQFGESDPDSESASGYIEESFSDADMFNLSQDIYSFIHISDTQYSTALAPYVFQEQCEYIAQNRDLLNIRFVAHTGDIIDCAPLENQWLNAKCCINILENAEIPKQIIAGNHDIGTEQNYREFLSWFGADTYINNYTAMYSYNNGEALVQLVDAGNGHIWMFAGTGWNPTEHALKWVASVMAEHTDCPAVIMTHDYLNVDGTISTVGRRIASYLVDPFPNARIVLCGHNHAYATNVSAYDDNRDGIIDRRVYAMLADFQADGNQETGKFRILTVSEPEGLIYVRTYSTQTDSYIKDDAFAIKMDGDWFSSQNYETKR